MPSTFTFFDMRHPAHDKPTPTGCISCLDALPAHNNPACRKIRSRNPLHQFFDRDLIHGIVIIYQEIDGIRQFPQVMRRNIGSHTDCNTGCPVHQHIGYARRKDQRLFERFVEVGPEFNRIFIEVRQKFFGYFMKPRLRVSHGCGSITIDRTEITLPVNKQVTHREILCHAGHGFVDCRVTMRMIFSKNFPHNAGRFFIRRIGTDAHILHGIQDPAMDRLEAIPGIWQGAGNDHAHCVIEISSAHLSVNVYLFNNTNVHITTCYLWVMSVS